MIPEMTEPLGRYWRQPADIRDAPIDDKTVLLTPYQFAELHNYSATMPSGVYPGKCWRRQSREGWHLGWYGVDPDPKFCTNNWRRIEVVT
jgi:hypothetical protein